MDILERSWINCGYLGEKLEVNHFKKVMGAVRKPLQLKQRN